MTLEEYVDKFGHVKLLWPSLILSTLNNGVNADIGACPECGILLMYMSKLPTCSGVHNVRHHPAKCINIDGIKEYTLTRIRMTQ